MFFFFGSFNFTKKQKTFSYFSQSFNEVKFASLKGELWIELLLYIYNNLCLHFFQRNFAEGCSGHSRILFHSSIWCSCGETPFHFTNTNDDMNVWSWMSLWCGQGVTGGVLRGAGKQLIGALCNLVGHYFIGFPIGVSLMFAAHMGILGKRKTFILRFCSYNHLLLLQTSLGNTVKALPLCSRTLDWTHHLCADAVHLLPCISGQTWLEEGRWWRMYHHPCVQFPCLEMHLNSNFDCDLCLQWRRLWSEQESKSKKKTRWPGWTEQVS